MRKLLPVILIVAAIIAFESSVWAQCSMCRTALESSPEGKFLASSFAHGILMLLFLPYIIFGTIATAVIYAYRKKKMGS